MRSDALEVRARASSQRLFSTCPSSLSASRLRCTPRAGMPHLWISERCSGWRSKLPKGCSTSTASTSYTGKSLSPLYFVHWRIVSPLCSICCIPPHFRDLKPDNVLLDISGTCKISDFGLARYKSKSYLSSKQLEIGTVPYMAPECITDHHSSKVSTQCDMYRCVQHAHFAACPSLTALRSGCSIGIVIIEMLNHSRPWKHLRDQMSIMYQVRSPPRLASSIELRHGPPPRLR